MPKINKDILAQAIVETLKRLDVDHQPIEVYRKRLRDPKYLRRVMRSRDVQKAFHDLVWKP